MDDRDLNSHVRIVRAVHHLQRMETQFGGSQRPPVQLIGFDDRHRHDIATLPGVVDVGQVAYVLSSQLFRIAGTRQERGAKLETDLEPAAVSVRLAAGSLG